MVALVRIMLYFVVMFPRSHYLGSIPAAILIGWVLLTLPCVPIPPVKWENRTINYVVAKRMRYSM